MESKGIPIGIRISEKTKERFDEYCDKYGIKKSFLLDKIIEEKLLELEEDEVEEYNDQILCPNCYNETID